MTKKVIITVGIFGVGKSYQADKYIAAHPEYKLMPCDDVPLTQLWDTLKPHDYVIMDYCFHKDQMAKQMKEYLQCEVELWILFDKPEVIVQRQLSSKAEMPKSPKDCKLVKQVYREQLVGMYDGCRFFDGEMKEYSREEFEKEFQSYYETPSKEEVEAFLERIDKMPSYDKYYHHFNLPHGIRIGKENYARNEETWAIIKDWFNWDGKRVLDLAGFHGYFCQEIVKVGGTPDMADRSTAALHTGAVFAKWNKAMFYMYHYDLNLKQHQDEDGYVIFPKEDYDMIMLFNVLHHLDDPDRVLRSMARFPRALFEVNKSDRPRIEKFFKIIKETDSPKDNRFILMGEPL